MTRVRKRGEDVRSFILNNVEKHPNDLTGVTAAHFKITRQAVNKHLQRLTREHALSESGRTRNRIYTLPPLVEWKGSYDISPALAEDLIWTKDVLPVLGRQPENVLDIWHYGFTELLNNAKDHSGGKHILVWIRKTAVATELYISDDGIGIFKKIQNALSLLDERHAILELSKGKLTTDPRRHTGEGIFFASRMFGLFGIYSGEVYFGHEFGAAEDWIVEGEKVGVGTTVRMKLSNHTSRTVKKIFDAYTSDEDYGFNKTVVPVKLAQYGNDKLVSRSQAKRVLARVELFKIVLFDFSEVPTIGQAFADEIFRVFPLEHPTIELHAVHANSEVRRMIERARSGRVAVDAARKGVPPE